MQTLLERVCRSLATGSPAVAPLETRVKHHSVPLNDHCDADDAEISAMLARRLLQTYATSLARNVSTRS